MAPGCNKWLLIVRRNLNGSSTAVLTFDLALSLDTFRTAPPASLLRAFFCLIFIANELTMERAFFFALVAEHLVGSNWTRVRNVMRASRSVVAVFSSTLQSGASKKRHLSEITHLLHLHAARACFFNGEAVSKQCI